MGLPASMKMKLSSPDHKSCSTTGNWRPVISTKVFANKKSNSNFSWFFMVHLEAEDAIEFLHANLTAKQMVKALVIYSEKVLNSYWCFFRVDYQGLNLLLTGAVFILCTCKLEDGLRRIILLFYLDSTFEHAT